MATAESAGREREAFEEGDDVDAALLEHRAVAEVDPVHLELGDAVSHGAAVTGEEGGADAVGRGAEAEVERRGLDLRVDDGRTGGEGAVRDQVAEATVGEDAGHAQALGEGVLMVGLAGFEPATFRPPDGRANQAAP